MSRTSISRTRKEDHERREPAERVHVVRAARAGIRAERLPEAASLDERGRDDPAEEREVGDGRQREQARGPRPRSGAGRKTSTPSAVGAREPRGVGTHARDEHDRAMYDAVRSSAPSTIVVSYSAADDRRGCVQARAADAPRLGLPRPKATVSCESAAIERPSGPPGRSGPGRSGSSPRSAARPAAARAGAAAGAAAAGPARRRLRASPAGH